MPQKRPIKRVGIHEWGTHPCPPASLRDRLREREEIDCEFTVCTAEEVSAFDTVVTLFHHNEFPGDVEWVHNIRSGYDGSPLDTYRKMGPSTILS